MIKNIVFDMGGVLIVWDPVRMLNQLHLSEADNELLNRELLQNPIWTEADAGLYTEEQLAQTACDHLPERLHQAVWALVQWYKWFLTPMPGMAALVRELKEATGLPAAASFKHVSPAGAALGLKENGYRIYLLSNAETNLRGYFPQIPGSECFDALMVSAEERLMKPSQEIYQRLFQKFDLEPSQCWFTDDNAPNVEAAIQAGMKAAQFSGDVALLRRKMREAGIRCKEEL